MPGFTGVGFRFQPTSAKILAVALLSNRGTMATIRDVSLAIARFEGFNDPSSLAARNNNPGNLTDPRTGAFRVFGSVDEGLAALDSQVQRNINRGLTLDQFFAGANGYAGYASAAAGNDPARYSATVSGWLNIPTDVPLSQVIGASWPDVAAGETIDTGIVVTAVVGVSAVLYFFWVLVSR